MAKKSYFTIKKSKTGLYALTWPGDPEETPMEPFSHKTYDGAKEVGLRLAHGHLVKEKSVPGGIEVHYEAQDKKANAVRAEEAATLDDEADDDDDIILDEA